MTEQEGATFKDVVETLMKVFGYAEHRWARLSCPEFCKSLTSCLEREYEERQAIHEQVRRLEDFVGEEYPSVWASKALEYCIDKLEEQEGYGIDYWMGFIEEQKPTLDEVLPDIDEGTVMSPAARIGFRAARNMISKRLLEHGLVKEAQDEQWPKYYVSSITNPCWLYLRVEKDGTVVKAYPNGSEESRRSNWNGYDELGVGVHFVEISEEEAMALPQGERDLTLSDGYEPYKMVDRYFGEKPGKQADDPPQHCVVNYGDARVFDGVTVENETGRGILVNAIYGPDGLEIICREDSLDDTQDMQMDYIDVCDPLPYKVESPVPCDAAVLPTGEILWR